VANLLALTAAAWSIHFSRSHSGIGGEYMYVSRTAILTFAICSVAGRGTDLVGVDCLFLLRSDVSRQLIEDLPI